MHGCSLHPIGAIWNVLFCSHMRRRAFLAQAAAAFRSGAAQPEVHAITRPPLFHWFGYYDKLQFDPENRFALGIANDFQHRLPTAADSIHAGMVSLRENYRWIELGDSRAWSWHQGCMLQWLPGSKEDVIWNDRQGDGFVARMMNVRTRKQKVLPKPIYCLSPNARWGFVNDFARSFSMRPETGYAGGKDAFAGELTPAGSGIWRVDLGSGKSELMLSLADVCNAPPAEGDWTGAKHYFDHLLVAPGGRRLVFLQRWGREVGQFSTRMFTMSTSGGELRMLDGSGRTSHFNWRDPEHLLVWTSHPSHGMRFYLVNERTGAYQAVAPDVLTRNGHCSYVRGSRWILTDTSPDKERKQRVYLFDTVTSRRVELGAFYSPPEYTGVWRCDTTPRASADGRFVIFDSPHGGNGRQMYLVEIDGLLG